MQDVYKSRPFKTRNAEEFDLKVILDLFVNPLAGLAGPFSFENQIVKGRMGSGKTMYLRANYAYYLYTLVPDLIEEQDPILPVMIRLSDFSHIKKPEEIYHAIILAIIEGMLTVAEHLSDAERLAKLHQGALTLPSAAVDSKMKRALEKFRTLKASEYAETTTQALGLNGGVKHGFLTASAEHKNEKVVELKGRTSHAGIADVRSVFENLLGATGAQMLLLIDEAGAVDQSFFSSGASTSLFETLMNQLRTADFVRVKAAVYPRSYSDILTETRYGDVVELVAKVEGTDYAQFRARCVEIVNRYVSAAGYPGVTADELFEALDHVDALEQLIYASNGVARRLVLLLDQAMDMAYKAHGGAGPVAKEHAYQALTQHTRSLEQMYGQVDRDLLTSIAKACRHRRTFRFQFPHKSPVLSRFVSKSEEQNLLRVVDPGAGRRGITYSFDYAYCVANDVPTHYLHESTAIDKDRSIVTGEWISRTAQMNDEIVKHAAAEKREGTIVFIAKQGTTGFVSSAEGGDAFFTLDNFVEGTRSADVGLGQKCRFLTFEYEGTNMAFGIELL